MTLAVGGTQNCITHTPDFTFKMVKNLINWVGTQASETSLGAHVISDVRCGSVIFKFEGTG